MNSEWRKVASSVYRKPYDSKIFGSVEVDVTDLEANVSASRKKGVKITLTHFFTLAMARAIRNDVPEMNCYIRRGKVMKRKSVDAMVSGLTKERMMTSVRVAEADRMSYEDIAEALNEEVWNSRQGYENATMHLKGSMRKIPWPLRE